MPSENPKFVPPVDLDGRVGIPAKRWGEINCGILTADILNANAFGGTIILRPNVDGDITAWDCFPDTGEDYYEDIDEVVTDDDTSYITSISVAETIILQIAINSDDPATLKNLTITNGFNDQYVDFDRKVDTTRWLQADINALEVLLKHESNTAEIGFETSVLPEGAVVEKLQIYVRINHRDDYTVSVTQLYVKIYYNFLTEYALKSGVQNSTYIYKATTGSANAYLFAPDPAIITYVEGASWLIKANFSNTAAATINISGIGVRALEMGINRALVANDIVSGGIYKIVVGAANVRLLSSTSNAIDKIADASATPGASIIPISDGSNKLDSWISDASNTVKGKVELAIAPEVTSGTDATRAVTPDALAGSTIFGVKACSIECFFALDAGLVVAQDVFQGDGCAYFMIPQALNGMNLIRAIAKVITAGTTNATTIDVYNIRATQDMLSGAISIASGATLGTAGTVNTSYDDVATNDLIRIDVTTVSTTKPKGLIVVLDFQLP